GVMDLMAECLRDGGLDMRLFQVLGEAPEEAEAVIEAGVDKVFLTGSNATGLQVLGRLARLGIPSVMELSGDDSVFVRPGADVALVLRALRFGVGLNNGDTCIAPKRVYAPPEMARLLEGESPLPVIEASDEDAIRMAGESGYGLGATVFGKEREATEFARRLNAGVVVINDMIVPTADPRVSFGGRGRSGFGVTRGPEGLLEMTVLKTIVVRRSRWLPHLDPRHSEDAALFSGFLRCLHGGTLAIRWRGLREMIGAAMRRKGSR
ncbi:MAG: aldehyde dehydrogenase family protein, partial [Bryobacteraceae bacterium]|nr:aldehyde dehydrogenase family protein [Bryobacteraceae bacterium]